MKKIYAIFFIHFQRVTEHRSRSIVWVLSSIFNPLLLLLVWSGATFSSSVFQSAWNTNTRNTYYLFMLCIATLVISHIEEGVAFKDIKEGGMVNYLLKPFPFYIHKFLQEIGYRLFQASITVAIIFVLIILGVPITISHNPVIILSTGIMICAAVAISFTYKMALGTIAFWIEDCWGIYQLVETIWVVAAGFTMPLYLYPETLKNIILLTPFPYMIYYPVLALQGLLSYTQILTTFCIQLLWIVIMGVGYRVMFRNGIYKFTAVGQ